MSQVDENIVRLVLQLPNREGIKNLQNDVALAKVKLEELTASWQRGELPAADYQRQMARASAELRGLEKTLAAVTAAEQAQRAALANSAGGASAWAAAIKEGSDRAAAGASKVDAATDKVGKASKSTQASVIELSRAFEDVWVTGSPIGAINNLNRMLELNAERIGLSAGGMVAASLAVTVLGAGLSALVRYFQQNNEEAKKYTTQLEQLKGKVEDLEKKPHKLAIDYQDLDKAKEKLAELQRDLQAYEAAKNKRTSTQQAIASGVEEAFGEFAGATDRESGVANVAQVIRGLQEKRGDFFGKDEKFEEFQKAQEALKNVKGQLAGPVASEEQMAILIQREKELTEQTKTLADEMTKRGEERIQKFIGQALNGEEAARKQLLDLFMQNRQAFAREGIGAGFGSALIGASPEFVGREAEVKNRRNEMLNQRRAEVQRRAIEQKKKRQEQKQQDRENKRENASGPSPKQGARAEPRAGAKPPPKAPSKITAKDREQVLERQRQARARAAKELEDVMPQMQAALLNRVNPLVVQEFAKQFLIAQGHKPLEAGNIATYAPQVAQEAFVQRVQSIQAAGQLQGQMMNVQQSQAMATAELLNALAIQRQQITSLWQYVNGLARNSRREKLSNLSAGPGP